MIDPIKKSPRWLRIGWFLLIPGTLFLYLHPGTGMFLTVVGFLCVFDAFHFEVNDSPSYWIRVNWLVLAFCFFSFSLCQYVLRRIWKSRGIWPPQAPWTEIWDDWVNS